MFREIRRLFSSHWPVLLWHLAVLSLLLTTPTVAGFLDGAMPLAPQFEEQLLVWSAAYLFLVVILGVFSADKEQIEWPIFLIASLACWSAGVAFLLLHGDANRSRPIAVVSWAVCSLAAAISRSRRSRLRLWAPLATVAAVGVFIASWRSVGIDLIRDPVAPVVSRSILTALTRFRETQILDLKAVDATGGGMASLPDGLLLVTGDARFFRIDPDAADSTARAVELSMPLSTNRAEFFVAAARLVPLRYRVTSVLADTTRDPTMLYVAHQFWDVDSTCVRLRVSRAALLRHARTATPWETVFDSHPCLPIDDDLDTFETGGRLAWSADGGVLLSVGDHGYAGIGTPALSQDPDSDYGKVFHISRTGRRRLVSIGHRNVQGLTTDRSGIVWSVEHGPQGGDELNVIRQSGNYGWPYATYGTDYGALNWPLNSTAGLRRDSFLDPVLAFVPSIAPSSMIEVTSARFAAWAGDLLIGTLSGASLVRIRRHGERVVYAEQIPIGRRIRDLVQHRDGSIYLWTEEGVLLQLREDAASTPGENAYALCASCHASDGRGTVAGPSLRGLVDRPVAARTDFRFSPALRALGGRWTRDRLDAFLANPAQFAPGTTMRFPGVKDSSTRNALMQFLLEY
jgi:cytochrome c2